MPRSKPLLLLTYFLAALILMESVLRIFVTGELLTQGMFNSLVLLLPWAVGLFLLCSLFSPRVNFALSTMLLGMAGIVFSSQLVYYGFFKTYYSFYSAGNVLQVSQFRGYILSAMVDHSLWILLIFLPPILLLTLGKKVLPFARINGLTRTVLAAVLILTHISGVATVYAGGRDQHSAYDLYYKSSDPIISMQRLGLLTTMRLDMQRLVTGWSPALEAAIIYPPPVKVEPGDDDPEPVIVEFNTLDIDFEALMSSEKNAELKAMHEYFQRVQPTAKNEHTGLYAGYNLILITAESFASYAVREDVTPTLYKMVTEGYQFTDFYTPSWDVSTTDGEYVALTGLLPKSGVWSFYRSADNYLPFVMGNQLNDLGYKTVAYHNHTYTYYRRHLSHPNMGYEYKGVGNGLKIRKVWPASDLEMMEVTVPEYIDCEPFHAYYMTVSGHLNYSFGGNNMARKNRDSVRELPLSQQAQAYLATQVELDRALEHLLSELDRAGIADRTLIALSTDHYPYGLDDKVIDELVGHAVERNFELYKNTFILYTQGMEPVVIDKPCSSLDIIPTLSNLLGLDYDSRLLMGRDIFADASPLVVFRNRSYITEKGRYNSLTKEFIPAKACSVEQEYVDEICRIVNNKFYFSTKILETDYYSTVLR